MTLRRLSPAFLLFALLLGACVKPGSSTTITASGVAPIEATGASDVASSGTASLAWAGETLGVSATVELDAQRRQESEPLALAAARLLARDRARSSASEKLQALQVGEKQTVARFAERDAAVADALHAAIAAAVPAWAESNNGNSVTVELDVELYALADAVLAAGGGGEVRPGDSSATILAEAAAQRLAFERAREELGRRLLAFPGPNGQTVGDLLRKYPGEQSAAQAWLFNARTLMSRRIAGDRWKIVLEADTTPLIRRFEVLETPRAERR